nr:MAG TPA: hypothetical protein [Caudoviricetes sp.]
MKNTARYSFFCQIRHGNIILITSITYKTMKEVHV